MRGQALRRPCRALDRRVPAWNRIQILQDEAANAKREKRTTLRFTVIRPQGDRPNYLTAFFLTYSNSARLGNLMP